MKYLLDTNLCIIYLKGRKANNLTLVTLNTREFGRVDGLQVEDWEVKV